MSTSCQRKSSFPGIARSNSTALLVYALLGVSSIAALVLKSLRSASQKQSVKTLPTAARRNSSPPPETVRIFEKLRTGFANWRAVAATRVRERSCCNSRPASSESRSSRCSSEPTRRSRSVRGLGFARVLTGMRDAGPSQGIAKDVDVWARAARVTPPEPRYGQPRFQRK